MVAWSGKGWLVAVCNLLGFLPGLALFMLVPMPFDVASAVLFALWGILSGAGVYVVAKKIESGEPRTLIDAATGEQLVIPASAGSFTFIPTRFWAILNPVGGVLLAVLAITHVWNPLLAA